MRAFSAVAPPTHIAVPVDRETGRTRGSRSSVRGKQPPRRAIKRFHGQPFQPRCRSAKRALNPAGRDRAGWHRVRRGAVLVDRVRAAGSAAHAWRLRSEARSLRPARRPWRRTPTRIRPRRQAQKAIPEREAEGSDPRARRRPPLQHQDLVDDGQDAATPTSMISRPVPRKSRRTTNNPLPPVPSPSPWSLRARRARLPIATRRTSACHSCSRRQSAASARPR